MAKLSVQPNLFPFLPLKISDIHTNKVKRSRVNGNEEPNDSSSEAPPGSASPWPRGDETNVSAEVTNPNRTEHQDVTVEKPSGSTTIIINNQLEMSADRESTISTDPTFSRQPSGVVSDIAQGILQLPVQPLQKFPTTLFGTKGRSFNGLWYHKYPWLEYSVQKDSVFCYACRLSSIGATGRADDAFTRIGYRDWKHASGKQGLFEKHNNCHTHKQAMVPWYDY